MTNHSLYISIIIILLIVLLFKLYIESDKNTTYLKTQKSKFNSYYDSDSFDYSDNNKYTKNNDKYEKMLEEMNKETMKKINKAVEQGYIEGFQAMNV